MACTTYQSGTTGITISQQQQQQQQAASKSSGTAILLGFAGLLGLMYFFGGKR